ncbi:hypothetical protein SUGI_0577590 [Cryptomeria japonica]|uniref:uncharacterized protein LOC131035753 n=1 Tax=Cryptomeria japonica TaxID=3369 RepID=UPI002408D9AA|nr:uncharacterized protein LOC131035753 [Cryptomeria japonica]GLJ29294.1 hypothetical protein SUGI_0577590 [Cryptomeria japonica]
MFRLAQAVRMATVALSARIVSPALRHFSVALNYHLDSQQKKSNVPWDFTEIYKEQKRRFASEADNANANHGEGNKETISVTFVDKDGEEKTIQVPIGMSMLEAAHQNDIELEGACEGSLACSTCHVIVMDENYYNKLEEPTDEENDMLDLAFALTETSRLGCQVIAKPELDGVRLALPSATRNFAVDGYVPKPH